MTITPVTTFLGISLHGAVGYGDGTARVMSPRETLQASYVSVGFEGSGEVTGISADGQVARSPEG